MGVVDDIWVRFDQSLADCRALYTHCLTPIAAHSESGIEAAFLQAFLSLEVLLEDVMVAYLTGESDCNGVVPVTLMSCASADACRKIINGSRGFVGWADVDEVKARFRLYFPPGSLDTRFDSAAAELREAKVCRNGIAHASGIAARQLSNLWVQKHGTPKSPLRACDVLRYPYLASPPDVHFDRYLHVMETLGRSLCFL